MCGMERQVKTVSKPQGSWGIFFFPPNCTIVSVSIETDGIAVKCYQQTCASKIYTNMFPKTGKNTYMYPTPIKRWILNLCMIIITVQRHMIFKWK
jgi:hypothetical protein